MLNPTERELQRVWGLLGNEDTNSLLDSKKIGAKAKEELKGKELDAFKKGKCILKKKKLS